MHIKSDSAIEAVLRRCGFQDLDDYNLVARNITLVLEGVDPATRSYVGANSMLKRQLAEVASELKGPRARKGDRNGRTRGAAEGSGSDTVPIQHRCRHAQSCGGHGKFAFRRRCPSGLTFVPGSR